MNQAKTITFWPIFECSDGTPLIDPNSMLEATAFLDKDARPGRLKITVVISNLLPITAEQIYAGLGFGEDTELHIRDIPSAADLTGENKL